MTYDIALFRTNFPEFADETAFPPERITFWSTVGEKRLNVIRWGDLYNEGMDLFVAHNIALSTGTMSDATAGRIPGATRGIVSSQSVGGVSVSRDLTSATETDAGYYNETIYGRQFLRLARMVGIGVTFVP
jgi:hypothetical protein